MKIKILICIVYLAFSICALAQQLSDCDFPPAQLLHQPRREFHGLYTNNAYGGYSVEIPDGLVGYDDKNPFYQRGFGIILGKKEHDYIDVNAEVNGLEYKNSISVINSRIEYMHDRGDQIESSTITETFMGKLQASALEITYTCPVKKERIIQYSVFALSPDKRFIYKITLYSIISRYKNNRSFLEKILRTWKYNG